MVSLAARYAAGEHTEVWRELDFDILPIREQHELGYHRPTLDDVEDVMRKTFERVARNVDTLVNRLSDLGYLFECEVGRYGNTSPPRSPALEFAEKAQAATINRFADLEQTGTGPFPLALMVFSEIVGNVDLCQRFPGTQTIPATDPVVSRLGDWDPLQVNFEYLAYCVFEDEANLSPLPDGGLALNAEIAASFEHKADISGAWNPSIRLPSYRADPMVFAEGIAMPFTTYLRRVFARGGFFGTPRPFFRAAEFNQKTGGYLAESKWPVIKEVEPGIWLPDHPVLADLARDLEPF